MGYKNETPGRRSEMTTPAPLDGDAVRDEIRRRAYLTGVLVGAPAVLANWLARRSWQPGARPTPSDTSGAPWHSAYP